MSVLKTDFWEADEVSQEHSADYQTAFGNLMHTPIIVTMLEAFALPVDKEGYRLVLMLSCKLKQTFCLIDFKLKFISFLKFLETPKKANNRLIS